jgi:hypothetical protein
MSDSFSFTELYLALSEASQQNHDSGMQQALAKARELLPKLSPRVREQAEREIERVEAEHKQVMASLEAHRKKLAALEAECKKLRS